MADVLAGVWIVGCIAFIFWRTNEYLKGPKLGKREGLTMSVRNGRIHFKRHRP